MQDQDGYPWAKDFNHASEVGMLIYLNGHSQTNIDFSVHQCAQHHFCPKDIHYKVKRELVATRRRLYIRECYCDQRHNWRLTSTQMQNFLVSGGMKLHRNQIVTGTVKGVLWQHMIMGFTSIFPLFYARYFYEYHKTDTQLFIQFLNYSYSWKVLLWTVQRLRLHWPKQTRLTKLLRIWA